MGPVENVRTLNLIQWAMQFMGLAAVFCSSSHQAASLSIVLGKTIFKIEILLVCHFENTGHKNFKNLHLFYLIKAG